jgi:prepilin-type N-terminal cleavage/methylation domain-containing protein
MAKRRPRYKMKKKNLHNASAKKFQKGFTLIEILVVVSIIGLLSSIMLVSYTNTREKSRIAAARSFAAQIDRAVGDRAVGIWNFNENSGAVANDNSGGGLNGTLYNVPSWSSDTPSNAGYSLSFNGLNAHVMVPYTTAMKYTGSGLTLAAWIKPNATETDGGWIISKPWNAVGEYNYRLRYIPNRQIEFTLGGTDTGGALAVASIYTTATVPSGKWSFIAATIDSSNNVKIYIDGQQKASGTVNIPVWAPSAAEANSPLAIGTVYPFGVWAGNSTYSFDGLIDDVRVYVASLLGDQVQELFAEGLNEHLLSLNKNK